MKKTIAFIVSICAIIACKSKGNESSDSYSLPRYVWVEYKSPDSSYSITIPSYLLNNTQENPNGVEFSSNGVVLSVKITTQLFQVPLDDLYNKELINMNHSGSSVTYNTLLQNKNAFVISGIEGDASRIFYKRVFSNIENQKQTIYSIEVHYPKSLAEHGKSIIQHFSKFPSASVKHSKTVQQSRGSQDNRSLRSQDVYKKCSAAVFMIITDNGVEKYQGSGFFISKDGLAVSNYHVFEGTGVGLESIRLSDGRLYKVSSVVLKDKQNDLIVFRVGNNQSNFTFVPLSKRSVQVGDKVYTIGSPRGLDNTFSSGEISQLRSIDGKSLIQINAPIDHGSSGGVLLNEYGEAIGVTVGGLDESGANLNFAIGIERVRQVLEKQSLNQF